MKETPLHSKHIENGAKMTAFGGWDMPLKFTSINEEHMTVRQKVGIFDVSHMGELILQGDGALEFMSEHCTQDVTKSKNDQLKYAHILNEKGGIIDDTIVTKLSDDSCYIVPNAGRTPVVLDWLIKEGGEKFVTDISHDTVMLAIQGPKAVDIIKKIFDNDITDLGFFNAVHDEINPDIMKKFDNEWKMGETPIIQRSGYTGEDGFEIVLPNEAGIALWDAFSAVDDAPTPCGLGARDTLRLEYGFLLSGQDFDKTRTTIETGWVKQSVDWDHDFVGKEKLQEIKGSEHQLLKGMVMIDKGIARHGYEIYDGDEKIGVVTSGTRSPMLKKGIALGYLDKGYHEEGTEVLIEIRGEKKKAEVKNPPFV